MSRGTSGRETTLGEDSRETTLGEDSRETTHKSRRIVVTVLTMAAVVVVTAVGGAALVSGTVTVGDGETPAGETVTVPVTLSQAADGVAGFRVRLELPDDETAAFVAASVGSEFGLGDKFVTPTTLELEGSDVDDAVESPAGTVRLGTVTVRGVEPGTVPIDVTVEEADDDSGDPVSTTAAVGNVTVTRRGDGSGGSDDTGVVPPTAALSGPTTATVGASITLDASESTDNAGITSYEWDTDGDGTFERSTDSPTLTVAFEQPENRTVTVRTVDFAGATDTASLRLTVAADTPANQTQTPAGGSETTPAATTSTPTEPPQTATATPPQTPTAAATPESPAPTAKTPATAQTPATRTTDAPSDRRTPAETATATPETERSRTTTGGTPETPPSTESRTQTQTQTPGFTAVLTLLALLLIVGRAAGRRRT
jgi:hypothetical protein